MIKGVDAQIMTQRAAEYSKDVSSMLRRDELANEFADRMNKLNAQQEVKTVSQLEKTEHARVRGDQERESKQQQERWQTQDGEESALDADLLMDLPSVGEAPGKPLLDIEV